MAVRPEVVPQVPSLTWIGSGRSKPFFRSTSMTRDDSPACVHARTGAGMFLPRTLMPAGRTGEAWWVRMGSG